MRAAAMMSTFYEMLLNVGYTPRDDGPSLPLRSRVRREGYSCASTDPGHQQEAKRTVSDGSDALGEVRRGFAMF